jgi:Ni,Fe-hydrogenase III large subunit/Ni,Fe-hydrogenase III component G
MVALGPAQRPRTQAVRPDLLAAVAAAQVGAGARLLTFFGSDERHTSGGFGLHAAFLQPDGATLLLRAELGPDHPAYPALTPLLPAAHWDERELRDLLGIEPLGHPDPRRLVLREDWPDGLHPLRKDFNPKQVPPAPRGLERFSPTPVAGEGVVSVPVGPIHAGIIEPGHFRFAAVGEVVLKLDAQLFYTHRGIEKLAEGRGAESALQVAERTCGACAFSHALAFSEAVESLVEVAVPPRAGWARAVLLELERLYNHLGDVGNLCAGVGFSVGTMEGARLKEQLQQLNELLVGHRFLRGVCAPGGLRRDLAADALATLRQQLPALRQRARDFGELLYATESLMERTRGTGRLPTEVVVALGGVGVAARASGLDADLRRDRPSEAYAQLPAALRVPLQPGGDVEARLRQRLEEAEASFALLETLLANAAEGPTRVLLPPPAAGQVGLGAVESPRGANVHAVIFGKDGLVERLRIRSASFCNWPLVPLAVPGNLMPDFPLINKSFELCYACLDR